MPDYMFLLESRLSPEQRAAMMRVQELAAAGGGNVYLVGGAVRDLISGMPIRDLDFSIEGQPSRVARELEKGGARVVSEDERLRHIELIFSGDVDGSLAAARDDMYARPGTKPEIRWSTIMEDLRRRDFSLNAIAISLNPASRGLLLDPTNGLADLEKHEVRALSIHSFTNQPVRLLRALRYCARMGFKVEPRTAEWFALAIDRGLQESISPEEAGLEVRQLAREEKPAAILKIWEQHDLLGTIHPQLARRHPDYEAIQRLVRVRDDLVGAGLRPRLLLPFTLALLGRLKAREQRSAMGRMGYRPQEMQTILHLEKEARKIAATLGSRKMAAPRDAFAYLERVPLDRVVYIQAELSNSKALSRIRSYVHKWRPLRMGLPLVAVELEGLGLPHGPQFDKVLEEFFQQQLLGKGRAPEDRVKLLRKLAGIKEPPKKKMKELKKKLAASKGAKEKVAGGAGPPSKATKEALAAAGKGKTGPASAGAGQHGQVRAVVTAGKRNRPAAPKPHKKSRRR